MRRMLDFYDDPDASVLRSAFPRASDVPDVIKEAAYVPEAGLPDSDFAIVFGEGEGRLRKFATADPGNTLLSVVYFTETHHRLSDEAQKVAAARLAAACARHRVEIPDVVAKLASGLVESTVKTIDSRFPSLAEVMNRIDTDSPEAGNDNTDPEKALEHLLTRKEVGGEEVTPNFEEKKADAQGIAEVLKMMKALGILPDLVQRVADKMKQGMQPAQEEQQALAQAAQQLQRNPQLMQNIPPMKLQEAARDLGLMQGVYTDAIGRTEERMPEHSLLRQRISALQPHEQSNGLPHGQGHEVTASVPSPYVQYGFSDRPRVQRGEGVFTLLSGRYPADTYSGVEKAASYFQKWGHQMAFPDRREYCKNLKVAARAVGAEHVLSKIAAYAGHGKEEFFGEALDARKLHYPDSLIPHLDFLKTAKLSADDTAAVLAEMDKTAELDGYWGGAIPDPWESVFHTIKVAEPAVMWQSPEGEVVDERLLRELAINHKTTISAQFDDKFTAQFQKDPLGVFKSLPDPVKRMIGRMCADLNAAA